MKLTSASSKATVSAVVKTSNGYASLVYIDVDGSATITGDKNSNLVYVVEYDGKYVTKDNETFYKYTVLMARTRSRSRLTTRSRTSPVLFTVLPTT
ncbi:MAG: hypothetical protein V8R27_05950 [Oscillospiraceae bacterium]